MTKKEELIKDHEQALKELADMKNRYSEREKEMTAMNMALVIFDLLGYSIIFPEDFIQLKDQTDELNNLLDKMKETIRQIDNKIQYEGLLITLLDD